MGKYTPIWRKLQRRGSPSCSPYPGIPPLLFGQSHSQFTETPASTGTFKSQHLAGWGNWSYPVRGVSFVFGWNLVRTCSSSFLSQRDVSGLCTYGVRWTSSTSDHPAAVTWSAQTVEQSNVPPPPPTNLSTCFLHQFVYSEVHVRKTHPQDRVEPGTKLIVKTCIWKTVSASVF